MSERIATLTRLLDKPTGPRIVLTTVNALVQRVPPRSAFAGASLDLTVNGQVQPEKLAGSWKRNGYGRAGTVMEPGEYAMRGGIVDIFPAGEPDPVRLDLFGDTIESIRSSTRPRQRSAGKRGSAVAAAGLRSAARQRHRSPVSAPAGGSCSARTPPQDPIYLSISDGRRHPGMEHWVPLFHPVMENAARLSAGRLGQPGPPGG